MSWVECPLRQSLIASRDFGIRKSSLPRDMAVAQVNGKLD